jgi:hypothetical protein
MYTDYQTFEELSMMGMAGALRQDVILWTPRLHREYRTGEHCAPNIPLTLTRDAPQPPAHTSRKHVKTRKETRVYASQYIGVTVWKGRCYLGQWTIAGRSKRGSGRPMTPEGERWAAQDRARALGLNYLEMRDGTLIPYRQYAPEDV